MCCYSVPIGLLYPELDKHAAPRRLALPLTGETEKDEVGCWKLNHVLRFRSDRKPGLYCYETRLVFLFWH